MAKSKAHPLGMSAMIASMVISGLLVVLNKQLLEDVGTNQLLALRFTIAVVLMIVFLRFEPARLKPREFGLLLVKSVLNVGEFILFYLGLERLDASLASILTAITPLLIYFGAVKVLHEKARRRVLIGLVFALIGAVIVSVSEEGAVGTVVDPQGLILISSSVILTAVTTIMSKSLVNHLNPKAILKSNTLFMALGFWLVVGFTGQWSSDISTSNWILIAISSVGLYFVYVLYYQALRKVKAEDTGVVAYLQYLAALVGAIVFLGERPLTAFWVGGGLIALGILIAEVNMHIKRHRKLHLHHLKHHQ
ncbi:MAG: DMT family transporter [Candidatus Saccharimonadales bacterium]|nr:DMT family transporter [Candidatus Saccharimonadales bacterium]